MALMSVLNVPWLPPAAPAQVCVLGEDMVMILLLTIRLKRSPRLSCKAPSKRRLINFYPAIPMSPGSAATQQQKPPHQLIWRKLWRKTCRFQISKRETAGAKPNQQTPPLHFPYPIWFFLSSSCFSFSVAASQTSL